MKNPVLTLGAKTKLELTENTYVSAVDPSKFSLGEDGTIYFEGKPVAFKSKEDYDSCRADIEKRHWIN